MASRAPAIGWPSANRRPRNSAHGFTFGFFCLSSFHPTDGGRHFNFYTGNSARTTVVKPWKRPVICASVLALAQALRTLIESVNARYIFARMKSRVELPFWLVVVAVLLTAPLAPAQNRVLELDGNGSYVELPPNIFRSLTQATVEVWAKWDSFRNYSRLFDFGATWQSMNMFNHARNPDLRFNLYSRFARDDRSLMHQIRVDRLLKTNEWIHVAAVSGPGGMKLYANGTLVGEHTNTASFADIRVWHTNLFGRGFIRNPDDQDFRGQMDEFRVWNHQRTEGQIRESMRRRLTGREAGLEALWNFDDGTPKDSGPWSHHGKLVGNARVVTPDESAAAQLVAVETTPDPAPATTVATASPTSRDAVVWWIAGTLTVIVGLLAWLVLTLKRREVTAVQVLPAGPEPRLLNEGASQPAGGNAVTNQELKERALAELTEFAKQSLVQGLYSQRNALLETQRQAQQELAQLEARLVALQLPDRIQAYEKRIADLELELASRSGEVRELISATLSLMRQKLEQEKQLERKTGRLN